MKGGHLDLSTDEADADQPASPRPFLGVKFECCGVYARVYKTRDGDAYEGRCPKCVRPIRFEVGEGGTASRFFSAS